MNPFPPRCRALFRHERLIASGGFGSVHLARQLALDRPVAIKLLDPARLADADDVARFLNEARVTATLAHPGIVVLIDHDVEDGLPWIAYEYVPGRTLRALIEAGPLDVPRALSAVRQVADALHAAHEREVIHRDIKPENVLEVEEGRYKVADFGIAKWSAGGVRTQAGLILGTPAYLAPEQILGEGATARTDLYSLGIMLHELLTGRPPFGNEVAALRAHVSDPPPPLSRPDVPAAVQDVVSRLLAKKPADRHESAAALSIDISRIIESMVAAPAPDSTVRIPRVRDARRANSVAVAPPPSRPGAPALGAAVLLVAGALAAAALVLRPRAPDATPAPPAASPSPAASPLAAIVAHYLPEFVRLEHTDRTRAAHVARACLRALAKEDPLRGPPALPLPLARCLVDRVAARHLALVSALDRIPGLNEAQTKEYGDLVALAVETGDALFAQTTPLLLHQMFARVACGLMWRRMIGWTSRTAERPLVERIAEWRRRYPDAVGPLVIELSYLLESGQKDRVPPKAIEILDEFARVHLPPRGPPPDAAVLEEWCRLVHESYSTAERAGARRELARIADIHARTFPRFGALMGHRAHIREVLELDLAGLRK